MDMPQVSASALRTRKSRSLKKKKILDRQQKREAGLTLSPSPPPQVRRKRNVIRPPGFVPLTGAERQRRYMAKKRGLPIPERVYCHPIVDCLDKSPPCSPPVPNVDGSSQVIVGSASHEPILMPPNSDQLFDAMCGQDNVCHGSYERDISFDVRWRLASNWFKENFLSNTLDACCKVCERIFFRKDVRKINQKMFNFLDPKYFSIGNLDAFEVCSSCRSSLSRDKIPVFSKTNGFVYQEYPLNFELPELNQISERLISPRIPFMSIRRLAFNGRSIIGQVINMPVDINNMVSRLPRNLDDDHVINVALKRHLAFKSRFLEGYVKKGDIRKWLNYLVDTPLYKAYKIQVDFGQLNDDSGDDNDYSDLGEVQCANPIGNLPNNCAVMLNDDSCDLVGCSFDNLTNQGGVDNQSDCGAYQVEDANSFASPQDGASKNRDAWCCASDHHDLGAAHFDNDEGNDNVYSLDNVFDDVDNVYMHVQNDHISGAGGGSWPYSGSLNHECDSILGSDVLYDDNDSYIEQIDFNEITDSLALINQQQTLIYDDNYCLELAPGANSRPLNMLYDPCAEELSFPTIYLGHPRVFSKTINATPWRVATSECRRYDRRGATPLHVLFMAMKVLRLRVVDGIHATYRRVSSTQNVTRRMLEDKSFQDDCLIKNLAFMRSIPNGNQYWLLRKKDLFAMIRQLGKPTIFLTITSNEMNWPELLTSLFKFSARHRDQPVPSDILQLDRLDRSQLVADDPVLCCIYFYKLINRLMHLLQSHGPQNPFGKYKVIDYFERYEFQHRGSPHAHILLWLDEDPNEDMNSECMPKTQQMIADLMSVCIRDVPLAKFKHQKHNHTETCFKRGDKRNCRFGIPFWPMNDTRILMPISIEDERSNDYRRAAMQIRRMLEEREFHSLDDMLFELGIDYEKYLDIIRSTLVKSSKRVFIKRAYDERYVNTFNPWILNNINSNMDIQFVLDEYACASYVADYVSKSDRGIGHLHRELIKITNQYPDFDKDRLLRKIASKVLNTVEMTSQEAAWYLLKQHMSSCSRKIIFLPTVWPCERHKQHKTRKELCQLSMESTDVWSKNIFDLYEERPVEFDNMCLADFACMVRTDRLDKLADGQCINLSSVEVNDDLMRFKSGKKTNPSLTHTYIERRFGRVIRYRCYDPADSLNYKREMVTLFVPFRNEACDILDSHNFHPKFLDIYDANVELIANKRLLYEKSSNMAHIIEELTNENLHGDNGGSNCYGDDRYGPIVLNCDTTMSSGATGPGVILDEFGNIIRDGHENSVNGNNHLASIFNVQPPRGLAVASTFTRRSNAISKSEYCHLMRSTNARQRELLLEIIHLIKSPKVDEYIKPLQIFFTGPAGSGKTYCLKLIKETYNLFSQNFNQLGNAYISCASTGKAAVQLGGTTIHSALRISAYHSTLALSRPLSAETLSNLRYSLFNGVSCVIIDEVSLVSSLLFHEIDSRLRSITGMSDKPFGNLNIIFAGDLYQLAPVGAGECWLNSYNRLLGHLLWQSLDYFPLYQVVRQTDTMFSNTLTKIGRGEVLTDEEAHLVESRFRTYEWCEENVPNVVRLFFTNRETDDYNHSRIKNPDLNLIAIDKITGKPGLRGRTPGWYSSAITAFYKCKYNDTNGLGYKVPLKINHNYMITANIDVMDRLVNGSIGVLRKFHEVPFNFSIPNSMIIDGQNGINTDEPERNNNDGLIDDSMVDLDGFNNCPDNINRSLPFDCEFLNVRDCSTESDGESYSRHDLNSNSPHFRRKYVVWLEFDDEQVGVIARKNMRRMLELVDGIQPSWVPILEKTLSFPLKNSLRCRRTQLPLQPAMALTIHKSQGGTFHQVVISYENKHINSLVYVALSRVVSINGLFLVNPAKDHVFYHKFGKPTSKTKLVCDEYRRLSRHTLTTLTSSINNLLDNSSADALFVATINSQSLRAHSIDIETDQLLMRSHILAITETWISDNELINIDGYEQIVSKNHPGGSSRATSSGVVLYVDIRLRHLVEDGGQLVYQSRNKGCYVSMKFKFCGETIVIGALYLKIRATIDRIKRFLSKAIGCYHISEDVTTKIILTGDFNKNLVDNNWLLQHLNDQYGLVYISGAKTTTLDNTVIDYTFVRGLNGTCNAFVSYFSYHRPLINIITKI